MTLPAAADSGDAGGRRPDGGLRSARDGFPLSRPPESTATPTPGPLAASSARASEERVFMDAGGDAWMVRVRGRGLSGTPPDRGAPLLLLQFRRDQEAVDGVKGGEMVERLVVARGLDGLSEEQLQGFLADALPPAS